MSLISTFNKGIKYLLCVIDLFSRYSWVIPLKNKKRDSIVEGFKKILSSDSEEIKDSFYEKELQKTDLKEFRIEKVIKKEGNKLYDKWKGYDNSFNSWINKKDIV